VKWIGAQRVAMLVDDTPSGAFTKGMVGRLRRKLLRDGASVTWTSSRRQRRPQPHPRGVRDAGNDNRRRAGTSVAARVLFSISVLPWP
jgi:hypothetical protein